MRLSDEEARFSWSKAILKGFVRKTFKWLSNLQDKEVKRQSY